MAASLRKDIFRNGKPFRYVGGEVFAYPGSPVLAVEGQTFIVPEEVALLVLNVVAVDVDAAVQISLCPRDVLANGGGEWFDSGAGSTLGTGVQAIDLPAGATGVRLFIHAAGLPGGTAAATFELYTQDAIKGEKIFTPEGGIGEILTFDAASGVSIYGTLMEIGTAANSAAVATAAATEFAGAMYSEGAPAGGLALVVKGIANVLLKDTVAGTAGLQLTSSTDAGRADCVATPAPYTAPDLAVRFGHALSSVLAGVDVLVRAKFL